MSAPAGRWSAPLSLLLVGIVELEAAGRLLDGDLPGFAALHLLACAVPPLALRHGRPAPGVAAALLRLLAPLLPPLGPFAAAVALAALLAAPLLGQRLGDPEGWRRHLFPEIGVDPLEAQVAALERAARGDGGEGVAAFGDVLRWGSLAQQERVVALMAREFRPGFAPLFREAMSSPSPGLRAQAAAGLSLVEARLDARAARLRGAAAEDGPAAALALARHLDDAANGGLLDPGRAAAARAEAVEIYRAHLAREPGDATAQAALGRDLMHLGREDDAIAALRGALARGPATPALLGWLAECLYRRGELGAVADLVAEHGALLRPVARGSSPLAPAVRFWLEEAPA